MAASSSLPALPSLRRAASGVLLAGLLSRVVGLAREILIAQQFGVGADLDAVYLGLAVPMALTVGLGGGLARAAVPAGSALAGERLGGLLRHGTVRLMLWLAAPSVLLAASAPMWVRYLMLGDDPLPGRLVELSAIMAALTLLGGALGGFTVGLLNAQGRHAAAALNPAVYNLIVCGGLLLLAPRFGALALAMAVLLAEWVQVAWQWPFVRAIAGAISRTGGADSWRTVQAVFAPAAVIGVATGANLAVDRAFASSLPEGAIAALSYADKLLNLPVGLVGTALAAPLFTRLSRAVAAGDEAGFARELLLGVRVLLLVGVPLAIGLGFFAEPIIGLLLARGAFGVEAVELSATALRGYGVAIPALTIAPLLVNAALARKKAWAVVVLIVGLVVLNAVADAALVRVAGLLGIAVATSLVAFVKVLVLAALVAPALLRDRDLLRTGARTFAFGALLGGAFWPLRGVLTPWLESDRPVLWAGCLACAAAVFLLICAAAWWPLLRPEWRHLTANLTVGWRRSGERESGAAE
ncbi:MAG: lipid II flippase MurJ [Sumerlaeia bacterium]